MLYSFYNDAKKIKGISTIVYMVSMTKTWKNIFSWGMYQIKKKLYASIIICFTTLAAITANIGMKILSTYNFPCSKPTKYPTNIYWRVYSPKLLPKKISCKRPPQKPIKTPVVDFLLSKQRKSSRINRESGFTWKTSMKRKNWWLNN